LYPSDLFFETFRNNYLGSPTDVYDIRVDQAGRRFILVGYHQPAGSAKQRSLRRVFDVGQPLLALPHRPVPQRNLLAPGAVDEIAPYLLQADLAPDASMPRSDEMKGISPPRERRRFLPCAGSP
jgi:hypothetical protein